VNTSPDKQLVQYTITPWTIDHNNNNRCPGVPITVDIWVEPTVNITAENDTICDGGSTNITVSSSNVTTNGIRYTWTVTDNPAITGELPSTGQGQMIGSAIVQTLVNSSPDKQLVQYTITPWTIDHDNNNKCGGVPITVDIWVEPTVNITAVNDTICDGESTSITVGSDNVTTNGIRYTWSVTDNPAITGELPSTGQGQLIGTAIVQALVNTSPDKQLVQYTITPWTIDHNNNNRCPGVPITVDIWVEPTVTITAVNDTICDGESTNITVSSDNVTTNGIRYTWTVTENPNVTGESGSTGTGQIIGSAVVQTLINTSNIFQRVTYIITPWTIDNNGNNKCAGTQFTVYAWVEPTPKVVGSISNDTICNNNSITYTLSSPTTAIYGVSFNVNVVNPYPEISGYSDKSDLTTSSLVNETLSNIGDTARMIMYIISPATITSSGIRNCPGINDTIRLWINPTPRVIPVNSKPAICYSDATEITLTTPTAMTSGVIRFDYSVSTTGVPGDIVGNMDPAFDLVPGHKIIFNYRNSAPPGRMDSVSSVFYTITPKVVGLSCPSGPVTSPEVQVHPKTIKYNYPGTNGTGIVITKPLTCEISAGLASLRVMVTRGAGPYQVEWNGPVNYHNDSIDITNLYGGKYYVTVTDNLGCINDTSITVIAQTARPQILLYPILPNIHVSCPGGSNGRLRVSVTSGITAPYTYWLIKNDLDTLYTGVLTAVFNSSDPNTFRIYSGLTSGNYRLVIRDVNGCIIDRVTTLNEPAPIAVDFGRSVYQGGFNVSCRGYSNGSAWVQNITGGNGAYTYQWYPETGSLTVSTTGPILDSIPTGKYYLVTTDMLGCIKTDSVDITEPDGMQLTGSEVSITPDGDYNVSCYDGSDGFIKLNISGGSGIYGYSWAGPGGFSASTKDISGLRAGTYTATVTDQNGCNLMPVPTFTLTQPLPLVVTALMSESVEGSDNINCNGGTGSINVTVSGGSTGNYEYEWSTSDGTGIIPGQEDQFALTAGTYRLVVTDLNNCISVQNYTLTQPEPVVNSLVPLHITCESPTFSNGAVNLTVTGGAAPYSFIWSNGAVSEDISNLTEGYYKVTVTDANGCSKTDSVRVELPPSLTYNKLTSLYNGVNISCHGLSNGWIQIVPTSGKEPFVYTWQGPGGFVSTSQNISDLRAGDYELLITDANQCTAAETITMTEPGRLSMIIDPSVSFSGGFNINCAGDSTGYINIDAVNNIGAVDYLWSDGATGRTRSNLSSGFYEIIITDMNSCYADTSIYLTQPDSMKLTFIVKESSCPDMPDGAIQLNVTGGVAGTGYKYKWSDNSTSQNVTDILRGLYKVTVTDDNMCTVSDSVSISTLREICLIIPNAISPNGDIINDEWNIGLKELYPELEIKIFNRWGELVWKSEKGYPDPWDGRSRGRVLPVDSYHYIIDLHNGTKPYIGTITIVK
jgi:gliding motility-associated-like protein